VLQWEVMTEALAAQESWWKPGAGHGCHVNTSRFLIGEVVRRITGQSLGTYLRDEIAGPAGIDFFIGFGSELDARCADVIPPQPGPDAEQRRVLLAGELATLTGPARMRAGAYGNPPNLSGQGVINTREWRAAEVPSTNGHGNASAVARLYAALAGGGDLDGFTSCPPRRWRSRLQSRWTGRISSYRGRHASVLGSSSLWRSAHLVRAPAPSGTSAPAARSGSPILMLMSPSHTP
jgi:CubicO group peptidase (beta-lactamase class C family)